MFTSKSAFRLTCFCKSASCWFWFSNFSFCSCVHFIRSFRLEMFLSGVPCQKEVIGYFQINCSVFIERQFCIFSTLILSGPELFRFSSRLVSFFFSCASSSSTLVTVSLFSWTWISSAFIWACKQTSCWAHWSDSSWTHGSQYTNFTVENYSIIILVNEYNEMRNEIRMKKIDTILMKLIKPLFYTIFTQFWSLSVCMWCVYIIYIYIIYIYIYIYIIYTQCIYIYTHSIYIERERVE